MRIARILLSLFFLSVMTLSFAEPPFSYPASTSGQIKVDLFLSSTCPHCHKADDFFTALQQQLSWITVNRYIVDEDKSALEAFYKQLQAAGSNNFAVPGIFFCGSRWTGFVDEQSTGKILLKALTYCHNQMLEQGDVTPGTTSVLRQWSQVNDANVEPNIADSPTKFILLTALMDSTNPCSMFCVAILFSFLWIFPKRRKTQWGLGITFIIALVIIHFITQINSAYFYQRLTTLRLPAAMVGLMLFSYALFSWQKYTHKRELIAVRIAYVLLPILVWIVFIFQQTCPLNIALIFEQWLVKNPVSTSKLLSYLAVYHLLYMLPLILLLVAYQALRNRGRAKKYVNALRYASGILLTVIAWFLIVHPLLLSWRYLSLIVFLTAIILGYLFEKYYEKRRSV
jgi:glutaredoxin